MRRYIPYLFLVVPLMEIAVFVLVGEQIGVLATILCVLFTATLGMTLLRWQGFGLLARIQGQLNQGGLPGRDLAHGGLLLVAGLLLLTPGFVTDTLGFLLFVPKVRDAVFGFLKTRINVNGMGGAAHGFGGPDNGIYSDGMGPIVDGEIIEPEDELGQKNPNSPWIDTGKRSD